MIVSRGRKYIFIHIPKTGGTSMALALEDRAMADDIMVGDTPKAKKRRRKVQDIETKGRMWKHSTLRDIDGLVSPQEIDDMFVFTMVRNPWDRLVSYYHWLREQSFNNVFVKLAKEHDFATFLGLPAVIASFKATPARYYMTDITGREKCDLYIRLEHLGEDLAKLEDHLGFSLEIAQENKSSRKSEYHSYYSENLAQLVSHIFQEDIEKFGYTF